FAQPDHLEVVGVVSRLVHDETGPSKCLHRGEIAMADGRTDHRYARPMGEGLSTRGVDGARPESAAGVRANEVDGHGGLGVRAIEASCPDLRAVVALNHEEEMSRAIEGRGEPRAMLGGGDGPSAEAQGDDPRIVAPGEDGIGVAALREAKQAM